MASDPVRESIVIHAPLERCFALSTRIELVKRTLGMRTVASSAAGSVTTGHVRAGSRVHWRGWKFGLPTSHHTLITGFAAPRTAESFGELHADAKGQRVAWFQDSQERGRFAFFQHDHFFRESVGTEGRPRTTLEDEVRFRLPVGLAGRVVARWVLAPYIGRLARQRFGMIKELAEGEGWQEWVENPPTS